MTPQAGQKKGFRRNSAFPKGRPLDETAYSEVVGLLDGKSLAKDLLIEHLHILQDEFGCLHARHLRALGEHMRLSQAEVYEVASFYHHFDIVKEADAAPAPVTIRICDSISCSLRGADTIIEATKNAVDPAKVRIVHAPCMGACDHAPAAQIGKRPLFKVTEKSLLDAVETGNLKPDLPDYINLESYLEEGGYALLKKISDGTLTADQIIETLSQSGLRGLGGAGFPAGKKWTFVRSYDGPRMMTINGDEGEPGTFKDRYYLGKDPHRMIEGALIAARAVEAEAVYLYMRDEYPELLEILATEIKSLEKSGIIPADYFILRRGAGAYICGEESAMIESIEGKRGLPRHRPPYIAQVGLFGRPTLNHNVETVYWLRDILEKGAEWFTSQGQKNHPGFRSYSVSGRVKSPGVKLAPAGITLNELVSQYCNGMEDGHSLKGYLPGGASGGILPASLADEPLDFGTLEKHGSFVGSHAVVVLSDKDNIKDAVLNLMRFFEDESCGQCTPCRAGTEKMVQLLQSDNPDLDLVTELGDVMRDASICGLGQAAPNPVSHLFKYFREEL
ncbi:MAG: NAD(P)H-dependent oxidoreductase subunit E [Cohaesibacteraceae bacterium]|nr:NAD(P)H-dependent oxidoreductase subunit E [Cohaesibacteraceae bacterium]